MVVLRMEPVADRLRRSLPLQQLAPLAELRADMERMHREALGTTPDLSPATADFMAHYFAVSQVAYRLLSHKSFGSLARTAERLEEEYMPGGPPMSPVYDSFSVLHALNGIPVGPGEETPMTVLARLSKGNPAYQTLHLMAREIALAFLDVYRASNVRGCSAELRHVRSGRTFPVELTGPFLRDRDLFLGRVIRFREERHFIADSPYLLEASESEWLTYLERAAAPTRTRSAEEALQRHLRFGQDWRYWLEYICNGYAGERRGIVRLAGLPDRPSTLPHHDDYDPRSAAKCASRDDRDANRDDGDANRDDGDASHDDRDATSTTATRIAEELKRPNLSTHDRLRLKLFQLAEGLGVVGVERTTLLAHSPKPGVSMTHASQFEPFLYAHCLFSSTTHLDGGSVLDEFERRGSPTEQERELIAAWRAGWFSAFEIRRIHPDEGLEVLDVLRRKRLTITDRLATRHVAVGGVLATWLSVDKSGTYRMEGANVYFPPVLARVAVRGLKSARDHLTKIAPRLSAVERLRLMPPFALIILWKLMHAAKAGISEGVEESGVRW